MYVPFSLHFLFTLQLQNSFLDISGMDHKSFSHICIGNATSDTFIISILLAHNFVYCVTDYVLLVLKLDSFIVFS